MFYPISFCSAILYICTYSERNSSEEPLDSAEAEAKRAVDQFIQQIESDQAKKYTNNNQEEDSSTATAPSIDSSSSPSLGEGEGEGKGKEGEEDEEGEESEDDEESDTVKVAEKILRVEDAVSLFCNPTTIYNYTCVLLRDYKVRMIFLLFLGIIQLYFMFSIIANVFMFYVFISFYAIRNR